MEKIKNITQLNGCTIYELWFDHNSICIMAYLNNRILNEIEFFKMYAEMDLNNIDTVEYRMVNYEKNLLIEGDYSFMYGLTWSCDKALSPTIEKEIEKCVKKIYAELRRINIERDRQNISCVVFEHSTKDLSCSYIPFVSYEEALTCMKNKYKLIINKYFIESFGETSISDDGSAEIKFAGGNSIVWQIYNFSTKKGK